MLCETANTPKSTFCDLYPNLNHCNHHHCHVNHYFTLMMSKILVIGIRTRSTFDEEKGEWFFCCLNANVHVIGCADKMNIL